MHRRGSPIRWDVFPAGRRVVQSVWQRHLLQSWIKFNSIWGAEVRAVLCTQKYLMMQRIYLTKKYPPHGKWRIPIFRHHCLILLIILSWLYLGINRKPYKCIPPDLRKNLAEARTFLHIAQFRMKAPDEIIDGQNVWSYSCPRRWRVQTGVIAAPM